MARKSGDTSHLYDGKTVRSAAPSRKKLAGTASATGEIPKDAIPTVEIPTFIERFVRRTACSQDEIPPGRQNGSKLATRMLWCPNCSWDFDLHRNTRSRNTMVRNNRINNNCKYSTIACCHWCNRNWILGHYDSRCSVFTWIIYSIHPFSNAFRILKGISIARYLRVW